MHGFKSSWLLTFRSKMAKRKAMPTLCPFRGQYKVSLENTHCQFAKIFEELPQCKVHSFLELLIKSILKKIIYMYKYWLCLKATLIILALMRRNIGLRIASGWYNQFFPKTQWTFFCFMKKKIKYQARIVVIFLAKQRVHKFYSGQSTFAKYSRHQMITGDIRHT